MTALPSLQICDLRLWVHLGWSEEEKKNPQMVSVDVTFTYASPPRAMDTDNLKDTICYHSVTKKIQSSTLEKRFNMIEFLGKSILDTVCTCVKESQQDIAAITVTVHKTAPPMPGVHGGTRFTCTGKP